MPSYQELAREFYATQLGLSQPWPSVNELQALFYMGVKNGDIVLGGGTIDPADVQVAVTSYLDLNPPEPAKITDELMANSPTTFAMTRAAFVAQFSTYSGPVVYNSERYLDHPAPPDYQAWDIWIRRRTL